MLFASGHPLGRELAGQMQYRDSPYLVRYTRGALRKFLNGSRAPIGHWEDVRVDQPDFSWSVGPNNCSAVVLGVGEHFLHPGNVYWNRNVRIRSELDAHERALSSVREALGVQLMLPGLPLYQYVS